MTALDALAVWRERYDVPNAAAAVVTDAGVVETAGDPDHSFYLASVTKLFSATAVAIGVEEGAVGLDEAAGPPGATLRHLLAHTSGYGFESSAPVLSPPGTRRIYSNRGIEEATAYLARMSAIPFETYLPEAVLEPLGLTGTELRGSTATSIWTTVTDLARLAAELLNPTLLSQQALAQAVEVQWHGLSGVLPGHGRFDPLDWGLGFERNFGRPGHWAGQRVLPSAFGHFGGSGTFLWVDPVRRVAAVCLTDRDFDTWSREAWPALCDRIVAEHAAGAGAPGQA